MAKQSGLAYNAYVDGYNISGDVGAISKIGMQSGVQDMTSIDLSARARQYTLRDGEMGFSAFYNPTNAQEHTALKNNQGNVSVVACIFCGLSLGSPVACIRSKQATYDFDRTKNGSLLLAAEFKADGFGTEWAEALTAGVRADGGAVNGASIDRQNFGLVGASSAFGASAYLEMLSFAGTDVTVKIQDSADNAAFADVAGLAFTQIVANVPHGERVETGLTAVIRRYLRAVTVTAGGFANLQFAVAVDGYLGARDP